MIYMKNESEGYSITNLSGSKNENQNRKLLKSVKMRNIDVFQRFFEKISKRNLATFSSFMTHTFNSVSLLNGISCFESVRD